MEPTLLVMYIRAVTASDATALSAFFGAIPEGDRMFFKEDVLDPDVVGGWTTGDQRGWRLLGLGDDGVVGYVAVLPGLGWSSHVGELRLVVAPGHRRRGVGRDLARRGLLLALDAGLTKVVVEVVADQSPAVALFQGLGFEPEALLRDHVRDRSGDLRDLMVLAHHVMERWADLATIGIAADA